MVDGKRYSSHVLAVFYMTGEWPVALVDHRDVDPANNRWDNLRLATASQNQANTRVCKTSSLGTKGVGKTIRAGKVRYRARLHHNGKRRHLGYADTIEGAKALYDAAAMATHGEYSRSA
jgi:hypothetical protein